MKDLSNGCRASVVYYTGKPEERIPPSGVMSIEFPVTGKEEIKLSLPARWADLFQKTYQVLGPVKLNAIQYEKIGSRRSLTIPSDPNFVKGLGTQALGIPITIGKEADSFVIAGYAETPGTKDLPPVSSLQLVRSGSDGVSVRLVAESELRQREFTLHYDGEDGQVRFDAKLAGKEVVVFSLSLEAKPSTTEGEDANDTVTAILVFDVPLSSADVPTLSYRITEQVGDDGGFSLITAAGLNGLLGFDIHGRIDLIFGAPFGAPSAQPTPKVYAMSATRSLASASQESAALGFSGAQGADFEGAGLQRSEVTGFASFCLGNDIDLLENDSRDIFFQQADLSDAAVVTLLNLTSGTDQTCGQTALKFTVPTGEGEFPLVPASCKLTLADGTSASFPIRRSEPGECVTAAFASNDRITAKFIVQGRAASTKYVKVNDPAPTRKLDRIQAYEVAYELTSLKVAACTEPLVVEITRSLGSASTYAVSVISKSGSDTTPVAVTTTEERGNTLKLDFSVPLGKEQSAELKLSEARELMEGQTVELVTAMNLVRKLVTVYQEIPTEALSSAQELEKEYLPRVLVEHSRLLAEKAKADAELVACKAAIADLHNRRQQWGNQEARSTDDALLQGKVAEKLRDLYAGLIDQLLDAEANQTRLVAQVSERQAALDAFVRAVTECLAGKSSYQLLGLKGDDSEECLVIQVS